MKDQHVIYASLPGDMKKPAEQIVAAVGASEQQRAWR
jgi:hypothetical protein